MLSSALDYALDHSTDSEVSEPCLGAGHVVQYRSDIEQACTQ